MAIAKFELTTEGKTIQSSAKRFAMQWARFRAAEGKTVQVQEIATGKRWKVQKIGRKIETAEL